ncbi:hypothetical protein C8J57DRAFT_1229654 [Mycena rebaudengoi]|nr:hypothetical protein C8J57DRAFT_1229654 [Mycena rebaudengoi]
MTFGKASDAYTEFSAKHNCSMRQLLMRQPDMWKPDFRVPSPNRIPGLGKNDGRVPDTRTRLAAVQLLEAELTAKKSQMSEDERFVAANSQEHQKSSKHPLQSWDANSCYIDAPLEAYFRAFGCMSDAVRAEFLRRIRTEAANTGLRDVMGHVWLRGLLSGAVPSTEYSEMKAVHGRLVTALDAGQCNCNLRTWDAGMREDVVEPNDNNPSPKLTRLFRLAWQIDLPLYRSLNLALMAFLAWANWLVRRAWLALNTANPRTVLDTFFTRRRSIPECLPPPTWNLKATATVAYGGVGVVVPIPSRFSPTCKSAMAEAVSALHFELIFNVQDSFKTPQYVQRLKSTRSKPFPPVLFRSRQPSAAVLKAACKSPPNTDFLFLSPQQFLSLWLFPMSISLRSALANVGTVLTSDADNSPMFEQQRQPPYSFLHASGTSVEYEVEKSTS